MASLYVTEQGATLRKEQNRLVIERDGSILTEVHDFKIERVVIFGNVQVTTQAITHLLDRGIDTTFLSLRGRLKGRLAPLASKNVLLRARQYERAADSRFILQVARAIVAAKISNCSEVLARHQRNHQECDFQTETSQLSGLREKANAAHSIDALRGIEGQAASVYFAGFARMLRGRLRFSRRKRRPPTDPVNSLLS